VRGDGSDCGQPAGDAGGSSPARDAVHFGGSLIIGRAAGMRTSIALIWLAFIVFPLINAVTNNGSSVRHVLTFAGAAVFVAAYLALVLIWRQSLSRRIGGLLFAVLVGSASALTLADRSGWAFLFTYAAACAGLLSTARFGFYAVAGCTVLAAGESLIAGAGGGAAVGYAASCAGIGLLIMVMRDLRVRNEELTQARAELARLAVAAERERFARDLHDLLGHSLSVIALKAELAGRLLPDRPADAAREVGEVEQVARNALGEVRDAVSGYWRPTLDGELEGARVALSAAGIEATVERPAVALDPAIEAVLAWAVREGATNVIRHSHARTCTITVGASLGDAAIEVVDDGAGCTEAGRGPAEKNGNGSAGHGLEGLAERARELRGRIEAGSRPEGGFRLAVTLPTLPAR
jgi:two-component system, NarL family, sensor histidine kinase DesK